MDMHLIPGEVMMLAINLAGHSPAKVCVINLHGPVHTRQFREVGRVDLNLDLSKVQVLG